jgi:histidinol-phosphate aminotransferase
LVKLNTNENPYPPSPAVQEAVSRAGAEALRLYPSPDADPLRETAARLYGQSPERILCGNGSDEILSMLMRTFVGEGDTVAYFRPSYSLYPVLAALSAARTVEVPLPRSPVALPVPRPEARIFFLTTPNSPYGFGFPTEWIRRLIESFPGIVVADEAYADFAAQSSLPLLSDSPRLIVVRSLSKAYSLAGMRIGIALAHEALVAEIRKVKDSYNLSRLAQEAARAALADGEHLGRTVARVVATRESFSRRLRETGFTVLPSDANFVFAVPPGRLVSAHPSSRPVAEDLAARLLDRGFLVRHFSSPELSDGLRISIGREEDMDRLIAAVREECRGG